MWRSWPRCGRGERWHTGRIAENKKVAGNIVLQVKVAARTHMGQISQEVYLIKICFFSLNFGQSILENDRLRRLEFFTIVLLSQSTTSILNIWNPT